MEDLNLFRKFAKKDNKPTSKGKNHAVIYTRVSSKEQAENNFSLDTQQKHCELLAERKGYTIVEYFGGTFESAKSDGRKEFQRMLSYVKRHKSVGFIIVYSYDRWSRTGSGGMHIKDELKKRGVDVLSATQVIDLSSSSGVLQQNILMGFSRYDNDQRAEKTVAGIQEKLRRGHINGSVPFGYTNLNPGKGNVPNLIINEQGKLLKKAFEWKATLDLSYKEITERLKPYGWTKGSKKLSDYFRNPIYCGLITSKAIPDEVIEGKHPPLVSREVFLKINGLLVNKKHGDNYKKENDNLPLKSFVVSDVCGTPYTGYLVKKKNLYYYKNNRIGSKENRGAKQMHELFERTLDELRLDGDKWIAPLKQMFTQSIIQMNKECLDNLTILEGRLTKAENNIDKIERRFALGEIDRELYIKFKAEFEQELMTIQEEIQDSSFNLSNLEIAVEKALNLALNLPGIWASGNLEEKRRIQKLVFPEGIRYDLKNDVYRTDRINYLFLGNALVERESSKKENGTSSKNLNLSRFVPGKGVEPSRPRTHAPQACTSTNSATRVNWCCKYKRYFPNT